MQSNKSAPPGPISPAYDSDEEQLFRNKDLKNEVQDHSEISSQKSVEVVVDESKLFPGGDQPELRSESEERRYNEIKKKDSTATTTAENQTDDGATTATGDIGCGTTTQSTSPIKKPRGRPRKTEAERNAEAEDKAREAEKVERARNRAKTARQARELHRQSRFHADAVAYVERLRIKELEENKPLLEMQKKIADLERRLKAEEEYETESEYSEISEPETKQDYTYNSMYYSQPKKIVFY